MILLLATIAILLAALVAVGKKYADHEPEQGASSGTLAV
jgi:hypothetical protein